MTKTVTLPTQVTAILVCFAVLFSGTARAGGSGVFTDVELSENGSLPGRVCLLTGQPVPGASVKLWHSGKPVAAVVADRHGKFTFSGVRGGVHNLEYAGRKNPVRVWVNGSAPEKAQRHMALTAAPTIIRGQSSYVSSFGSNPATPPSCGHCGLGGHAIGGSSNVMQCCPSVPCDPCTACDPGIACAPAGHALLDAITLTAIGSSVAAVAISIDNRRILKSAVLSGSTTETFGSATTSDSTVASP